MTALLLSGLAMPVGAVAQSTTAPSTFDLEFVPGEEVVHFSRLPLWGAKEARDLGFKLPLPLGISGNVYTENQDFRLDRIRVGPGGDALIDIGSVVQVSNITTEQTVLNARLDGWVLPFLNVYGIAGYVDGHADMSIRPGVIPMSWLPGPNIDLTLNYDGPVVGFGSTVAGGGKPFKDRETIIFGMADLNFTQTYLGFDPLIASLDTVDVTVLSMRVGVRDRIWQDESLGEVHLSLWGGAMYQAVQSFMTGRLGIYDLAFSAEVDAVSPWSPLIGGRVEIGEHWDAMLEVGFGHRQSLLLGLTYRF